MPAPLRILVVENPRSGGADAAVTVADELRARGLDVQEAQPGALPDATHIAAHIDRLVASGGDGTLGCVATLAAENNLPLGVVPRGTGNDFARGMGIPLEFEAAVELAATGEREELIDLGHIDGGDGLQRPFLNVASFGVAPHATHHATRFKRVLGPAAYAAGTLRALIGTRPLSCHVEIDGDMVHRGQTWQVTVAGTGSFGGGAEIGPAKADDTLLDVVIIPTLRGPHGMVADLAALRRGTLTERPGVVHLRGRVVTVHVKRGTPLSVDGEVLHAGSEPVRLSLLSRALRIIVPEAGDPGSDPDITMPPR